jgi:uncharacterized membrane protein
MFLRRFTAVVAATLAAGLCLLGATAPAALSDTRAAQSHSDLQGVACPRPNWCMAVGSRSSSPAESTALAEVWNGKRWRVVPVLSATAAHRTDYLQAVSCPGVSQCLAVGEAVNPVGSVTGLAARWNGRRWRLLRVHFPAQAALFGVSCAGRTCMIVGQRLEGPPLLSLQLTGNRVVLRAPRVPRGTDGGMLTAVSCTAAASCMAVGEVTKAAWESVAESWNGTRWRITSTPHPAGTMTVLSAVSCPKAALCLAGGAPVAGNLRPAPLTLLWQRGRWHSLKTIGLRETYLVPYGISCPSLSRCLVVGMTQATARPGALIWNGRSLRYLPVQKPAAGQLNAISCSKRSKCMAVGGLSPGSTVISAGIAELWKGKGWKELPLPGG